jgi:hypothetical protein
MKIKARALLSGFSLVKAKDTFFIYAIPLILATIAMRNHLPDRNYDRRNAYEYNVWALLSDRYSKDWMPSGLGSYLNPAINVPAYLVGLLPIFFSYVFGLMFLVIYLKYALKILDVIDRKDILKIRNNRIAMAIVLSSSPLFLSELGTAMSGYTSSVFFILSAFYFIDGIHRKKSLNFLVSGILMGFCVHFKLVNTVAAMALIPCFALINFQRVRALFLFAVGLSISTLAALPWYIFVYLKFGNPVYPLFNHVFKGSYYPESNFRDSRWSLDSPEKFLQLITGFWARINTEIPAFDFRIFLISALFVFLISFVASNREYSMITRVEVIIITWFILFSIIWSQTSFIARYFMPGELMVGILLFILLEKFLGSRMLKSSVLVTIAVIVVSVLHVPNWNTWQEQFLNQNSKVSELDSRWQFPSDLAFPKGSQVLTLGEPISYIFKYFPKNYYFINIGWPKYNSGVDIALPEDITSSILSFSDKNIFLTALPISQPESLDLANSYLSRYRLHTDSSVCESFRTSSEEFWLCSLKKL